MTISILPPQSTQTERVLETALARPAEVPVEIAQLWNPQTCPVAFLPWLAFALSVDEWDANWSETTKRAYIAVAISIHRKKGTAWSIKAALKAAGYGDAELFERSGGIPHNGSISYNGAHNHAAADHWAEYRVTLHQPISIRQATSVRALLDSIAPARCRLAALDFTTALNLYDGAITHDGVYSHGVA